MKRIIERYSAIAAAIRNYMRTTVFIENKVVYTQINQVARIPKPHCVQSHSINLSLCHVLVRLCVSDTGVSESEKKNAFQLLTHTLRTEIRAQLITLDKTNRII